MDDQQRQLVQLIADQVLKMLQQQGADGAKASGDAAGGRAAASTPRAEVRPPIGICTGDYSKFTELQGRDVGAPPPGAAGATAPQSSAASAPPPAPAMVALSGIVTASQLQQAMDAADDGVAVITDKARLTPLASDLARQHPQRIRRVSAAAIGAGATSAPAAIMWGWWMDGHCPAARGIVQARSQVMRAVGAGNGSASLAQVIRDLASAVRSRQLAGAVLFVRSAAKAVCFANRCPSLRAVVATCGEAVEEGIRDLGANVLVVEYPHHGEQAMSAMVDRFVAQEPRAAPALERELADLHRCS